MLTITVDPLNDHSKIPYGDLINQGGGLLSTWIVRMNKGATLQETLFNAYGEVPYEFDECHLENGFSFVSYDDEGNEEARLSPYIVFAKGGEQVAVFPYGIVAILNENEKTRFYRMD